MIRRYLAAGLVGILVCPTFAFGQAPKAGVVTVLTPASIVEVLRAGYEPKLHPSARATEQA